MSVMPEGKSGAASGARFEIKSTQLPGMALLIKSEDVSALAYDLLQQFGPDGESPGFFENDLLTLDFSALPGLQACPDLQPLLSALRQCHLTPTGVRGVPGPWQENVAALGLADLPPEVRRPTAAKGKPATTDAKVAESFAAQDMVPTAAAQVAQPAVAAAVPTMVVDKPLRSGQKVYARGGDLVVLAMVNQGAEVVADGNIHVYAPLRGKAMAGARGNGSARIFSLCLEPELVSIAGVYRTSENPFPKDVAGKPAQVRLSSDGNEKLIIEALKN